MQMDGSGSVNLAISQFYKSRECECPDKMNNMKNNKSMAVPSFSSDASPHEKHDDPTPSPDLHMRYLDQSKKNSSHQVTQRMEGDYGFT